MQNWAEKAKCRSCGAAKPAPRSPSNPGKGKSGKDKDKQPPWEKLRRSGAFVEEAEPADDKAKAQQKEAERKKVFEAMESVEGPDHPAVKAYKAEAAEKAKQARLARPPADRLRTTEAFLERRRRAMNDLEAQRAKVDAQLLAIAKEIEDAEADKQECLEALQDDLDQKRRIAMEEDGPEDATPETGRDAEQWSAPSWRASSWGEGWSSAAWQAKDEQREQEQFMAHATQQAQAAAVQQVAAQTAQLAEAMGQVQHVLAQVVQSQQASCPAPSPEPGQQTLPALFGAVPTPVPLDVASAQPAQVAQQPPQAEPQAPLGQPAQPAQGASTEQPQGPPVQRKGSRSPRGGQRT